MAVRLSSFLLLLSVTLQAVFAENLLDLIKGNPQLSKMAAIIEKDALMALQLQRLSYTAFIPTDEAMEGFQGPTDMTFMNAHFSNSPMLIQNIGDTFTSAITGNPEMHITKIPNGKQSLTGWEDHDYYVNNAKVIRANQKAKAIDNVTQQMLHIIDAPLTPTRTIGSAQVPSRYPSAADVLMNYRSYGLLDQNQVQKFQERVKNLNEEDTFKEEGAYTFFVPVDSAITKSAQVMDQQVIHGHIVPGRVMFTRPASLKKEEVESLAFTDNLKVLIKMDEVKAGDRVGYYVSSNTVAADMQHPPGTAIARIIKANIPVRNGVMHLIDRRLMTTADSIMSYLKEEGGQLSEFHKLFQEHQKELLERLAAHEDKAMTIFAPSNYAFSMVKRESLDKLSLNSAKLGELLKLHIVTTRLTTDNIKEKSVNGVYQMPSLSQDRQLYFSINDFDQNRQPTVYVEGAGVNATITTPNIVAKNGVIHIIDRILGIPSQTIFEKLESSPTISITYNMSSQDNFNKQFMSRDKKFTFFVPSNDAWSEIEKTMPSSYRKLTMGDFPYHVKTILQRHMIANKDLSVQALSALTSNRTFSPNDPELHDNLEMVRGKIHFQGRVSQNGNDYYLQWQGLTARIQQADVECVNGVIHIIDKVMMSREDVTVAGASQVSALTLVTTSAMLLVSGLLR